MSTGVGEDGNREVSNNERQQHCEFLFAMLDCDFCLSTVADPKILKGGGDVKASSSFIANAHNELFMPSTEEKMAFWKKFWANEVGAAATNAFPLEPATDCWQSQFRVMTQVHQWLK